MMVDSFILKEDVDPSDYKSSDLTTDCYYVYLEDGSINLARGSTVGIFDMFYDKKKTITRIQLANGSLNPKLNKPNI